MKLDQFIKFCKKFAGPRQYSNAFVVENDKCIYTDGFFLLEVICITGLQNDVYNLDGSVSQIKYPNYKEILDSDKLPVEKDCTELLHIADIICMNKKAKSAICIVGNDGKVFAEEGVALDKLNKMTELGFKGLFCYGGGRYVGTGIGVKYIVGMAYNNKT